MDRLSVQSLSLVDSNGDMQFHFQVPCPYDAYTTRISPCWNRPCGALESIQQETLQSKPSQRMVGATF
jgi:hypothetical protein